MQTKLNHYYATYKAYNKSEPIIQHLAPGTWHSPLYSQLYSTWHLALPFFKSLQNKNQIALRGYKGDV